MIEGKVYGISIWLCSVIEGLCNYCTVYMDMFFLTIGFFMCIWMLKTFLVWQLLLSMVFLKRQFSLGQIAGCIMVLVGVTVALSG